MIYLRIAVNIWYCVTTSENKAEIYGLLVLLSGFGCLAFMRSVKELRIFMALFKEVFMDVWMFAIVMVVLVYSIISAWFMSDSIRSREDPEYFGNYSWSTGVVDIMHFAFGEFDDIDNYSTAW